jgi:hypothetical protein
VSRDIQASIPDLIQNHVRAETPRTFESFSQAAAENAASRIFLGIHYRFDAIEGVSAGDRIADYTFDNLLRPRDVGGTLHVPSADYVAQIDAYLNGTYKTLFTGGPGPGSFTPNEAFLNQVYLDVLGRRIDDAGHAAWMSALAQGMSREEVVQQILNSPECQMRAINQAYQDMLGRNADEAGLAASLQLLANGGTMTDVRASIATSTEFSSGPDFLDKLYHRILGRAGDEAGLNYWNSRLAAGASRLDIALAFLDGSECLDSRVAACYQNFLERAADPAGEEFWISLAQTGGDDPVRAGILGSLEYFQHVNPT